MTGLGGWLALVLAGVGLLGLLLRQYYKGGQLQERDDHTGALQKKLRGAAHLRDRLRSDPGFAERVRQRFKR